MNDKGITGGRRNSRGSTTKSGARDHRRQQTVRSAARLCAERLEQRVLLSTGAATPAAPYLPPQHELLAHSGFLTKPAHGKPLTIALNYLRSHASSLGIKASDLANPIVTNQYTDPDTGETHIYLRQRVNGLQVANANLSISLTRDNRVIMASGDFVHGASAKITKPTLSAQQALTHVAPNLRIPVLSTTSVKTVQSSAQAAVLSASQISKDPIPASAEYVATPSGLKLAWQMVVRTTDGQHWYQTFADAGTGASLGTVDWTDHLESYDVYALPIEAPNDCSRSIVTDPADPTYSPFGWHDTNGIAGAEFTVTDGNNVNAYVDANNSNTVGFQPNGGSSLNFDFPIGPTQAPSAYQSATVSQLFYLVNELHDIDAHYGFTEAAGNFQQTDYSGQGLGNDQVLAEDQDGGGTNNANFATPPDGQSPRMQMYNWTYATPARDSSLDSEIVVHEFGHGVSNRLTGGPANASALTATQSGGMGEGWSDWWALMFTQKPSGAQNDAYPQGTYVMGQTTSGNGIRRYPYSFNMTTDPLTYARYGLNGDTEVHDTGEIWCSTLWDMNWLLIQKYGYSPTISQGYNPSVAGQNGGNNLALKLVMDALKLQPANPSFTNARDAIIAADQALNGGKDLLQIWTAFARRGLGYSAVDSSANATTVTTAFDVPLSVQYPQVVSQSPTGAQTTALSSVDFTFNTAMDPTSFSIADDVKSFNGPAGVATPGPDLTSQITGFSWLNSNTTVHITFAPQSAKGRYTMTIGPQILSANSGAAMDQNANGTPGEATADQYTATFGYEPTLLQVISTTPASGSLVSLPLTNLDVHFNEPFDPASIGVSDLTLNQGKVTAATAVDATTARYTLSGITSEGTLNISMPAGAVNDVDGFGMQAFSTFYTTDIGTLPLPTAASVQPLGSLIYQTSSPGVIGPANDTDSFTINLDAGQTLTVTVSGVTTLQPTVQVSDASSNVIGTATASAAGQAALLETLPTGAAGIYTITVGGANQTVGGYTVTATLNAAQKAVNFGGPSNQTQATAQDLSGSFESLGSGASRAAVLGGPNGGTLTPISNNFESGLGGFVIANTTGGLWHLSTGRGSQTGHSATQSLYFGQGEGPNGGGNYSTGSRVAGTVTFPSFAIPAGTAMSLNFNYVLQTEGSPSWDQALVQISTNGGSTFTTLTNLSGTAESTSWRAATPISLSAYAGQTVQLRFSFDTIDGAVNNFEGWYIDDVAVSGAASTLTDYYSLPLNAGDSASLALKGGGSSAALKLLDNSGNVVASSVSGATNVDRAINSFVVPSAGTYYALVSATANASAYSVVISRNAAFDLEPNGANSPQTLGAQTAALGAISGADEDRYSLTLAAGQSVSLHTQTPGGGPGEFVNLLDPALALYNSGGTLVASDDNSAPDGRNAQISYAAPAAGTYTIRVFSNNNSSGEYVLNLGDALTLSAPHDANEGDGTVTATVTAPSAPASDVTIALSSSDPSRISAPATVVLPAGQTSVSVPMAIIDNNLLDGLESVTITASAATYYGGSLKINVHDNETAMLTVSLPATATEGDGTISGTITSSAAPTRDISVLLSSDLPSRLTVPATVTLNAGQTTATFNASVIDNAAIDGTQTANITANVENWTGGTAAVSIADNDAAVTVTLPATGWEGQTLSGTVHIGGTLANPLVVNLGSSDTTTLTVPASVTIPAGQTSISFTATLIDDGVAAGSRTASITATASGLAGGSANVTVHDIALDHLAFDPLSGTKTAGSAFAATVRANNVANELIAVYSGAGALSASGTSGALSVNPSSITFTAGVWSGNVTLTKADPNVILTATSGVVGATSSTFAVQAGSVAGFTWGAIATPQVANLPIPATITAKDAWGNTSNFNGTATLNGQIGAGISQSVLGNLTSNGNGSGSLTGGIIFTPSINAQVTSIRGYSGTKISIWTSSGTLLASQPFSGINGTWVETPFSKPITLLAGGNYRIAAYSGGGIYYYQTSTPPAVSWGTITGGCYAIGDAFPSNTTSTTYMADLRANVGFTPVGITPSSVKFANGIWTGNLNVVQAAADMHLHSDDGAGHTADSNNFDVVVQTLGLSLPTDVREDDGIDIGVLNVTPAPATDMTVTLTSSDPSRLSVPAAITVPAGATSVAVPLTPANDNVLEGPEALTVSAAANRYTPSSAVLTIHDSLLPAFSISLPTSASEGDGTVTGTVTASTAPNQNITINLISSRSSQLSVPPTVTLPAGQTSATFNANILDNKIIDGTASSTVTASANGWTGGFASMSIADIDNSIAVSAPSSVWEGQSYGGIVTIGGTLATDLTVFLSSNNTGKLTVPASVTIAAGQTSAVFGLAAPSDNVIEGLSSATITATAPGLMSGSSAVSIQDSNVDHLAIAPINSPQTAGGGFATTVFAYNISGQPIAVYNGAAYLTAAGQSGALALSQNNIGFTGGVWNGTETLNVADPAVVLTVTSGSLSANSNSFVVQPGAVTTYLWSRIATPQFVNVPFAATLKCFDFYGNVATNFNGSVTLSGASSAGSIAITPTKAAFVNGTWSGNISVLQGASGMNLNATDASHVGSTNNFDVIGIPQAPLLNSSTDSGVDSSDHITNFNNSSSALALSFSVAGTVSGATVRLYINGTLAGSNTANSTITVVKTDGASTLNDGVYTVTARQALGSGLETADSQPLQIIIDTVAPPAPPAPVLDPASDGGASSTDGITNNTLPSVDVTAGEAGRMHVEIDGSNGTGPTKVTSTPGTVLVSIPRTKVTYAAAVTQSAPGTPNYSTVADFNNDGIMDVVAPDAATGNVYLLPGNGTGSLKPPQLLPNLAGTTTQSADLNADGKADLVLCSGSGSSTEIALGNGDGTFATPTVLNTGPGFVGLADMNGDRITDIVFTPNTSTANYIQVYLGVGDGSFLSPTTISAPTPIAPGCISDVNKDGKLDVVVSGGGFYYTHLYAFLGNGDGTFQPPKDSALPHTMFNLVAADFNRDGNIDIAGTDSIMNAVHLVTGNGKGIFANSSDWGVGQGPGYLITADLNMDGISDMAVANNSSSTVSILTGDGGGGFSTSTYSTGTHPWGLSAADMNGDGKPDLIVANGGSSNVGVYLVSGGVLSAGTHTLTAWAEDLAGNRSPNSPSQKITIDRVAPVGLVSAPAVTAAGGTSYNFTVAYTDAVGVDVNSLANALTVRGPAFTIQPAPVNVSGSGAAVTATYSFTPPGGAWNDLQDGTYAVIPSSNPPRDLAGNPVAGPALGLFVIAVPRRPLAPDLDAASDSGFSSTDNLTTFNNSQPTRALSFTVGGTAAGDTILLYIDGVPNGSATAAGSSTDVTSDGATTLADGAHLITARRVLSDGTQTPESAPLQIVVDTAAPAVTGVTTTSAAGDQTTYTFTATWMDETAIDASSLAGAVSVSGPGFSVIPALSKVTPAGNGGTLTATYVFNAPGGFWDAADNGLYIISTTASGGRDTAGNAVVAGQIGSFSIDIPLTTAAPDLDDSTDSGSSSVDNITRFNNSSAATALRFMVGGLTAGNTVLIYADGNVIGSALAGGNVADVACDGATALGDGVHNITARQIRPAGDSSASSQPLSITIDTIAPTVTLSTSAAAPGSSVIGQIALSFSEPIYGLGLNAVSLSFYSGPSVLTADQMFTTTNPRSYALENLAAVDAGAGDYSFSFVAGKVADLAGNVMIALPSASWNTDPLKGTAGNDSYYLKADGGQIDLWFNQPTTAAPAIKLARNFGGQVLHGMGGNDTITIDNSAGDISSYLTLIDSTGIAAGKVAFNVIGTGGDDIVSIDGSAGTFALGSQKLTVNELTSLQYSDAGGNDTVNVTGPLRVTIDVGSGVDTLNLGTGVNVTAYIRGGSTGDLIINGNGNTTIWYI